MQQADKFHCLYCIKGPSHQDLKNHTHTGSFFLQYFSRSRTPPPLLPGIDGNRCNFTTILGFPFLKNLDLPLITAECFSIIWKPEIIKVGFISHFACMWWLHACQENKTHPSWPVPLCRYLGNPNYSGHDGVSRYFSLHWLERVLAQGWR